MTSGLLGDRARLRAALLEGAGKYLFIAVVVTVILAGVAGERSFEAISVRFVIDLLISLAIGLSISLLHLALAPLHLDRRPLLVRALTWVAVLFVAIVGGAELALQLVALAFPDALRAYPRSAVIVVSVPITLAAVATTLALDRLKARAAALEVSEAEAQRALLRAQLDALQARVNPHFLFNSLNTVAALIGEDPERAERAVERLAQLYRYTLEGSRKAHVRLAEELESLESYLELERLRFGDRLSVAIDAGDTVRDLEVPPLLLQPLVENAIKHGVAARRGPGRVEVRANVTGDALELAVEDDGPGPGSSVHAGTRTSLEDLRRRIALLYSGTGRVTTGRGALGGFEIKLSLPLEKEEKSS